MGPHRLCALVLLFVVASIVCEFVLDCVPSLDIKSCCILIDGLCKSLCLCLLSVLKRSFCCCRYINILFGVAFPGHTCFLISLFVCLLI